MTRSTDIFHHSTASEYFKDLEDSDVDGSLVRNIHTTVYISSFTELPLDQLLNQISLSATHFWYVPLTAL